MQARQGRTLDSLINAREFLTRNADVLPAVATSGLSQTLDTNISVLTGFAEAQEAHALVAQSATQKFSALRSALIRDHMAPIAGVARARLPHTPELAPLRMPRGRRSAERLSVAAKAMAQAAEPFSSVFLDAGLPADFLARLNAAADAMTAVVVERSQIQGLRRGATEGLSTALVAGRKSVHALDRIVTSALKDNPALLANWKSVMRVRKSNRGIGSVTLPTAAATPVVAAEAVHGVAA